MILPMLASGIQAIQSQHHCNWSGYITRLRLVKKMINLYNGRVIVQRNSLAENWTARIKLPNCEPVIIDLDTPDLRKAFIYAQYNYLSLYSNKSIAEIEESYQGKPKCWSCIHWTPRSDKCSFGFPEARTNKGRYARKCSLYEDDGTESTGPL